MHAQLGRTLVDQSERGAQSSVAIQNEIEFDPAFLPQALKVFNVQVVESAALRQKNVVLISRADFQELFGDGSTTMPAVARHLQIADKVYRVMIGPLQTGCMAITNIQKEALSTSLFSTATFASSLSAMPFDATIASRHPLKSAEVHVVQDTILGGEHEKFVIAADELRGMIKEKLKTEFPQPNFPFTLQFPWGEMRGEVRSLSPSNVFKEERLSYGAIMEDTKIKLHPLFSNQVVIVDEIYSDEVSHFEFQINLEKRLSTADSNSLPLVLSADEIKEAILSKLTGVLICKGYDIVIQHPSGWDIRVRLSRAVLDLAQTMQKTEKILAEDLQEGYVIKKSANIRLKTKITEALLTQGPPIEPQEITFKVADIPGGAVHPLIDLERERWVDVNELFEKLTQRSKPFALNETFNVNLTSGTYCIMVSKVFFGGPNPAEDQTPYQQSFLLSPRSKVHFEAEKDLEVNLLRDRTALPLAKATFQVKALRAPEDGMLISGEELKMLIASQGPKQFVHNQSFELRTEQEHRLELKLVEIDFRGGAQFEKNLTSIANLDQETEINFSAPPADKVKVVHTVYRDEIEKLKFSLSPSRRKGVDNLARVPLVLDHDEVLEKVKKEISTYKYILEGFSFQIPYGDGWDIDVKFHAGILKREHRSGSTETRFVNVTSKKGYAPTRETALEFVPFMKDIILAQGEPVLASSLNLKLVEVLENHSKDPDTIVKGNWINLEELKAYLFSMTKPLAKQQRFVADLESGKFVLEVASAKSREPEQSSEKGSRRKRFAIQGETKIDLSIEARFGLQKVNSGLPLPLKKIEFTVFPEQAGSDHVSLKDQEILKAIHESFAFPVINKHLFAVTTESCHRLRLEVKEMIPLSGKKSDLEEMLGIIGPETEIVLRGKEEANLAIRTTPKILEAKNPIAYLEQIGIGGIEEQFQQIMRIFYTRSDKLADEVARRGTKPIKGVLLYGPPGTGKTTLARHIGDMLGCSGERLIMLTATEIFNMWFGGSEEKIRALFSAAREAQEKYGEKSPLYVICIDEIDALLPERGTSPSNTKDGLVNQFLGEMDGLNELKNVLVVGITNRKENIDPAALRHGRFGVHINIPLPDKKGREKIFSIHMKKLQEEGLLDESIKIDALAEQTEHFSGADIEGLIEEASQYSLERLNQTDVPKEALRDHPAGKITMKDFKKALGLKKKDSESMSAYIKGTMYV